MLPSFYHNILEKYLNPKQLLTLNMLVWLLQSQKQVRIERLAATLPLTILQNSRRRHIQRFLLINVSSMECDRHEQGTFGLAIVMNKGLLGWRSPRNKGLLGWRSS